MEAASVERGRERWVGGGQEESNGRRVMERMAGGHCPADPFGCGGGGREEARRVGSLVRPGTTCPPGD